jgi:SAM-dependent methyltransferase
VISSLERVVPAQPGKPVRPEAAAVQARSRAIAEDPGRWSATLAQQTTEEFTRLAPVWDDSRGQYRPIPLRDALDRGGPFPAGLCVEVGCGTGLLTEFIAGVWSQVVSLDLTWEMVRRSPARWRLNADAARLPVADRSAAAVVIADVPLFADEVVRILAPGGVVVWSNALGAESPHHVPVEVVAGALARAQAQIQPHVGWDAVTAEAGWGLWAVLRRGA